MVRVWPSAHWLSVSLPVQPRVGEAETAVNTLRCHRASQVSQGLHVMKICHTMGESRGSHRLRIFSTFIFHLLSNFWLCPCQPNLMDAKSQITDVQPVPLLIRHGKLRQHFSSVCVFVLLFILSVCAWTWRYVCGCMCVYAHTRGLAPRHAGAHRNQKRKSHHF